MGAALFIDGSLYFFVSGIIISPEKGRYNYIGTVVKCCVWPSYEVILHVGISKMPISADLLTKVSLLPIPLLSKVFII